ncbi:MAG: hypothetical protein ACREDS_13745, partial [Limisphaerales bacterium]
DFIKLRQVAKKHFASHGLVIPPPWSQLIGWRNEAERTGAEGGVIHPQGGPNNVVVRFAYHSTGMPLQLLLPPVR